MARLQIDSRLVPGNSMPNVWGAPFSVGCIPQKWREGDSAATSQFQNFWTQPFNRSPPIPMSDLSSRFARCRLKVIAGEIGDRNERDLRDRRWQTEQGRDLAFMG